LWDDDPATFTVTNVNDPPMFGAPSLVNASTGNLLNVTWNISINDPDGDFFSWTIHCSNGQNNSGTNDVNGTKPLVLLGLAYSTTYKVWVNATDPTGSSLWTQRWYVFTTLAMNLPPLKPLTPAGKANGKINVNYTYTTGTTDPNGDQVSYWFDWGDGNNSGWVGPYASGATGSAQHLWTVKGSYSIKVKARDIFGAESNWSDPLPVAMPTSQGDVAEKEANANTVTRGSSETTPKGSPTAPSDTTSPPATYGSDTHASLFGHSAGSIIRAYIDLILSILRGEHRGENIFQLFRAVRGLN
jgi:hypothetical protein